jgi:hypothetical protein
MELTNFKTGNIKGFFPQHNWWKFISPAHVRRIPHLTTKCSSPIDQAKQSRVSCAKLLTASPYRKQLREYQEKETLSFSDKPATKKAIWNKE